MKKRSFILLFIVGLVGLFLPKGVFAFDYSIKYSPMVDYRFFVENEDEEDIGNLQFKLHDSNNLISYDSQYDPNTNAYYFIDVPQNAGQEDSFKNIDANIFPEYLLEEFENIHFNNFNNYQTEWRSFLYNISQKYSGLDYVFGIGIIPIPWPSIETYIPMILEEVNHTGDGEPIKKVVFAIGTIITPMFDDNGNINELYSFFTLVNNSCMYKSSNYMSDVSEGYVDYTLNKMRLTRNQTFDYSDEILNKYSLGNVSSNEIQGNEYLNKGFLNDKFSTGEIASSGVSFNGKEIGAVKLRNSSDNLKEELLKDYCDCLPVFVQARKAPSIVEVITNPKTFTTGVMVLAVSLLLALGFVAFILTNQKKNDNEA